MSKHSPHNPRYAECLLFLLNTDPTTYKAATTVDDWMWYRYDVVGRVQSATILRRFPNRTDGPLGGHKERREESRAAQQPPKPVNCDGRPSSATEEDRRRAGKGGAHVDEWLHNFSAEGRLEYLRCCPGCSRFF